MKLSKEALIEIMSIVQNGLLHGEDISENLRALDFDADCCSDVGIVNKCGNLVLSQQFKEWKILHTTLSPVDDPFGSGKENDVPEIEDL